MKKILILVDYIKPCHTKLSNSVQKELGPEGVVTLASFSDIFIHLHDGGVTASVLEHNIFEFDLVYFRRAGKFLPVAHTLGVIFKAYKIPFVDSAYGADGTVGDKFTSLTRLSLAGLPIIESCFLWKKGSLNFYEKIEQTFGYPLVCKDRYLQRGSGVSLIKNRASLETVFTTTKRQQFLFQKFITSAQEYRLLVLGGEVRVFEKKTPTDPAEFRANVSLGAKEEFLELGSLPHKMSQIALQAAGVLNLEVAGVDIMEDTNGKLWLLEVNRGPGLTYDESLSPELFEMGHFLSKTV